MNKTHIDLDWTAEEALIDDASDEALEAAAGPMGKPGAASFAPVGLVCTINNCG